MELTEWTIAYIDNLNAFRHDLISKSIKKREIECEYKLKGTCIYLIESDFNESILHETKTGNIVLVGDNTKQNLAFVINNWQELIKNPKLKIIFANTTLNLQWSILPCTHNMISDPGSLKLGLKTLFEAVPEM